MMDSKVISKNNVLDFAARRRASKNKKSAASIRSFVNKQIEKTVSNDQDDELTRENVQLLWNIYPEVTEVGLKTEALYTIIFYSKNPEITKSANENLFKIAREKTDILAKARLYMIVELFSEDADIRKELENDFQLLLSEKKCFENLKSYVHHTYDFSNTNFIADQLILKIQSLKNETETKECCELILKNISINEGTRNRAERLLYTMTRSEQKEVKTLLLDNDLKSILETGRPREIIYFIRSLTPELYLNSFFEPDITHMLMSTIPLFVWKRDNEGLPITITSLIESFDLGNLVKLSRDVKLPEKYKAKINAYLDHLPGFNENKFDKDGFALDDTDEELAAIYTYYKSHSISIIYSLNEFEKYPYDYIIKKKENVSKTKIIDTPFASGSEEAINNFLIGLLPNPAAEKKDMWYERKLSLIEAVIPALIWLRDNRDYPLDLVSFNHHLRIENLIRLSRNKDLPLDKKDALENYLRNLPGYTASIFNDDGSKKGNPEFPIDYTTIYQQHGFLYLPIYNQLEFLTDETNGILD